MKLTQERLERIEKANTLLSFIATTDKNKYSPFFGHKEEDGTLHVGAFRVNDKNQLRYIDPYMQIDISLHPNSKDLHRKCTEGGTGQAIIRQLGEFIKNGKQGHLNDYKEVWGLGATRCNKCPKESSRNWIYQKYKLSLLPL